MPHAFTKKEIGAVYSSANLFADVAGRLSEDAVEGLLGSESGDYVRGELIAQGKLGAKLRQSILEGGNLSELLALSARADFTDSELVQIVGPVSSELTPEDCVVLRENLLGRPISQEALLEIVKAADEQTMGILSETWLRCGLREAPAALMEFLWKLDFDKGDKENLSMLLIYVPQNLTEEQAGRILEKIIGSRQGKELLESALLFRMGWDKLWQEAARRAQENSLVKDAAKDAYLTAWITKDDNPELLTITKEAPEEVVLTWFPGGADEEKIPGTEVSLAFLSTARQEELAGFLPKLGIDMQNYFGSSSETKVMWKALSQNPNLGEGWQAVEGVELAVSSKSLTRFISEYARAWEDSPKTLTKVLSSIRAGVDEEDIETEQLKALLTIMKHLRKPKNPDYSPLWAEAQANFNNKLVRLSRSLGLEDSIGHPGFTDYPELTNIALIRVYTPLVEPRVWLAERVLDLEEEAGSRKRQFRVALDHLLETSEEPLLVTSEEPCCVLIEQLKEVTSPAPKRNPAHQVGQSRALS